ncbi:lipoyl(octanoyl) transferase LipB [Thioalkalivibrio sp. XN279]|uniref:lipoyl(octanoyl) transferase LipB n=1 Tax=Thioalkalivibrio sp. XN279 TaxID=2714953 RepID=UPI001407C867|nr:lipoyl(octanoyl) transferase LipB [Thioalkalivibrio sp. XN279]NHA15042.1 lipoyl(octanoyl) transferase LipB [Thioalkalivibrio sp. XN279]
MQAPVVRRLGMVDYEPTWRRMQALADTRGPDQPDEIWLLQHPPVFTLGLNGSRAHLLAPGEIPVVQVDRGGQVTYHGPGQLVVYPLLDLGRSGLGVRALVCALERAVIRCVGAYGIEARGDRAAPGVYVGEKKLASIGLRIRRNCSYHGLALNVDMDLEPFRRINPCGFSGLEVTQLADLGVAVPFDTVADDLEQALLAELQDSASLACSA